MQDEIELYKARAEEAENVAEKLRRENNELRKERALRRIASADADLIDDEAVADLLADRVQYNPDTRSLEGVDEAISALKLEHPFLTFSGNPQAAASRKAPDGIQAVNDVDRARRIFGKESDSALANRLAKQNMTEYRRLRAVAIENGIF